VLPEPAIPKPVIVPLLGAVDDPILGEDLQPPLPTSQPSKPQLHCLFKISNDMPKNKGKGDMKVVFD
jgi:hypothetical protein